MGICSILWLCMMRSAILFVNGKISLAFCENYIMQHYKALPIYCADGAYHKITHSCGLSQKIMAVVGDGDSCREIEAQHIAYQFFTDQNSTDFDKALQFLHQKGYQQIIVFGADGGEMDHYLGHLSSVLYYRKKLSIVFIDPCSYSFLLRKKMAISHVKNHMISIIPLFMLDKVILQGCKYQHLPDWTD